MTLTRGGPHHTGADDVSPWLARSGHQRQLGLGLRCGFSSLGALSPAENKSLAPAQAWGPQKTKLTSDDFGAKAGGVAAEVDVRALQEDERVGFVERVAAWGRSLWLSPGLRLQGNFQSSIRP